MDMDSLRENENRNEQWFAFRVRPRHEKAVSIALRERECSEFLPLIREKRNWANRQRHVDLPLFPGYIFCLVERFSMLPILSTPGVIDVVRAGASPVAADTAEIEALRLAIDSRVPMERCSYMEVGNTVEIIQGPLSGLRGLLVNVRKSHRLVLSVRLLCRSVLIEIDPHWVAAHEESLILSDHTSPEFGMSC
jgi:transcription antitermination factor NusG